MQQQPDIQPGAYYVTATDAGRFWLLSGPYIDNHAGALEDVDQVRQIANQHEPRSHFYAFGTSRLEEPRGPGSLQRAGLLPIPSQENEPCHP